MPCSSDRRHDTIARSFHGHKTAVATGRNRIAGNQRYGNDADSVCLFGRLVIHEWSDISVMAPCEQGLLHAYSPLRITGFGPYGMARGHWLRAGAA